MSQIEKHCTRCKRAIGCSEPHKIVIYVVREKLSEHHYEHVECPDRFTV